MSVLCKNIFYEEISYRQLQKIAKELQIPANLKKSFLIQLIQAHQANKSHLVNSIVKTAMCEREESARKRGNKNISSIRFKLRQTKPNILKLAPKHPFVVLKNNSLLLQNTTILKQNLKGLKSSLHHQQTISSNIANPTRLSTDFYSKTKNSNDLRNMSCARTNIVPDNHMMYLTDRSADAAAVKTPRKNATMLETLLQAPMSSKLEDIAADCMRGDESQRVRTVKVVGDSEIKRPMEEPDFLVSTTSDSLMDDMTTQVIMDLRVVGSEAKQLQWDAENVEENQIISSPLDDSYLQPNMSSCYNYRDYSSSSDHDHQYRGSGTSDPFGLVDRKSILVNCSQDSQSLVDNLMSSLTSQNTSLDTSIDIHENPIKCQINDKSDFNMTFESGESDANKPTHENVSEFQEEVEHSDRNNCAGDFYNDSTVQDSYYSLDRSDQMSPRTYNSIFNEYLMSEMGVHEIDYSNFSSLPQRHRQETTTNILESQNSYLERSVQAMEQEGNINLHQELLPGQSIPDSMGQHDYPVLSLGSGVIGESDFDPISSALTLNFPNYGSLGLSPPRSVEVIEKDDVEETREPSKLSKKSSAKWDKSGPKPTAMLCFLCNWIGRFSSIENHLHKAHYRQIIQAVKGIVTLEVNLQMLALGTQRTKEIAIFQHRDRLFLIKFKFTEPNLFNVSVLAVPPQGDAIIFESPTVCFIQVQDPTNGDEVNWKGCVESLNLQPSNSNSPSAFISSSKKGVDMYVKNMDAGSLDSNSKRKILVDVMVQTFRDVLDIENNQ